MIGRLWNTGIKRKINSESMRFSIQPVLNIKNYRKNLIKKELSYRHKLSVEELTGREKFPESVF